MATGVFVTDSLVKKFALEHSPNQDFLKLNNIVFLTGTVLQRYTQNVQLFGANKVQI